MKAVLFSPIGGSDPISNQRDGSMLHICRRYHPQCVMFYLSSEMLNYQLLDDRYRRALKLLADEEGFKTEIICVERPDLTNPHLFDIFYRDFEKCLKQLHADYPGHMILLNLSSGTPAMKSALEVLIQLIDLPVLGIQVATPNRSHNGMREDLGAFDLDLFWEYNLDRNKAYFEDRCTQLQQKNLRAKLLGQTLKAHLAVYDYTAALAVGKQMDSLLVDEVKQLLNMAVLRVQNEWQKISRPLQERYILHAPKEEQLIFEYLLSLQVRQRRSELAEFLRGLTPALYQLSVYALKKVCGIDLELCCSRSGRLQLDRMDPSVKKMLDELYGNGFNSAYPNSDMCCRLIAHLKPTHPCVSPLSILRDVEIHLRNIAAHTITPITEARIHEQCAQILGSSSARGRKWSSKDVLDLIKQCAENIFECPVLRWNAYDLMNDDISHLLDIRPENM